MRMRYTFSDVARTHEVVVTKYAHCVVHKFGALFCYRPLHERMTK